jgi:type II secretory pathway component PulJ
LRKYGFSTIELILSMMIFSLVVTGFYGVMQLSTAAGKSSLKDKVELQKNTRRAQMKLIDEVSCAGEVVKPEIGSSAPFLVLVDKEGKISVYYQKEHTYKLEDNKTEVKGYKLFSVTKNPTTGAVSQEKEVVGNIKRLIFTTVSEGSVSVNLRLFSNKEETDLITQVTLKNYYAGEFIH